MIDIIKYIKDKWLNTRLSNSSPVHSSSFRVRSNSDQDSIKYINHKTDARHTNDEKTRVKRLMSTFGIHQEKHPITDQAAIAEIRVTQWLQQNEKNFRSFDDTEEDLDLSFWQRDETNSVYNTNEEQEFFK